MSNIESMKRARTRKRSFGLPVILAGGIASLVLALGISPSFAAFTASITNSANTAGSGSLAMQELNNGGTVTCNSDSSGNVSTNTATCATINKYGGNLNMIPGQTVTTAISIKNTGTVPATAFTLTPAACVQAANGSLAGTATDLCTKMNLVVMSGTKEVYSGTLAAFNASGINLLSKIGISSVPSGTTVPFSFAVTLDATNATNSVAGLKVSQPMTWTFTS